MFFIAKYPHFNFSLSILNGNGSEKDDNKMKDFLGHIEYNKKGQNSSFKTSIIHYEGKSLSHIKRRSAVYFNTSLYDIIKLKLVLLKAKDAYTSKGYWFQMSYNSYYNTSLITKIDHFENNENTIHYYLLGFNYLLPFKNSIIKFNYIYFTKPNTSSDFAIQLQVFYSIFTDE